MCGGGSVVFFESLGGDLRALLASRELSMVYRSGMGIPREVTVPTPSSPFSSSHHPIKTIRDKFSL